MFGREQSHSSRRLHGTCFHLKAIDHGSKIHKLIPERLLLKNVGISSKLQRLFSSNGDFDKAHKVFDQMPKRNDSAFPWNSLISGYAEVCLRSVGMIEAGEEVHRHVIRSGCGNNKFVQNALLDMYAKCGDISKARKVFDTIVDRDVVSWNSMIIGYMRHNLTVEALDLLRGMTHEGCEPDSITISEGSKKRRKGREGKQRLGAAWTAPRRCPVSAGAETGRLGAMSRLRCMPQRDTVSWNSIISAHSKESVALEYLQQMLKCRTLPNSITLVSLLLAYAHLGMVRDGERFIGA
ncbi:pentatricopeptide repeat-containing protein At4g25270, chloroplastic-like [Olea europaea var. sylvestris]|uniref:pentatricopeptide repeat-containing protein At4g25270, chloroplastic-like n=1 Tax=Olea europaea var. sylvestris TaxID=158386 RepID=UPI000C1D1B5E|nr:pentatricopeptide repeat-containing protein At4g25270, chloroplastic-like [Olea europaea var. sylvestris]